uniref:Rrm/rnp domain n=1 Tax=Rhizophora mucronata TaxID=61149 RepID=A0A2P2M2E8_RHIMU
MELKVQSPKPAGLPPSDVSDPEEKEVTDEDDDDRNHKHRRRETRSQSLERHPLDPAFTRPYRKYNRPFGNEHPFRPNQSQASETWKNHNLALLENSTKFEKRRPRPVPFPQMPLEMSQRTFSGDPTPGRGRGRDSGSWNPCDSRCSSVDLASQIVQQGSVASSLFSGRGLPTTSNAQNASWNAFGLIPGIPNGGLDTLHSIGLQGTLRPTVNSSLPMGIPQQRCRDFEERGFCLRGDMCPMEHGVNHFVVEDVQSLSQFNLSVSLATAPLVGIPAVPGALQSVGAPSTALMNSKRLHSKRSKAGMGDDALVMNGSYSSSAAMSGTDLYDPDQPLWNNSAPETSNALLSLHLPKNAKIESMTSTDPSNGHGIINEGSTRNARHTVLSQGTSSSVWGRIGSSKNKSDVKEKTDPAVSNSDYLENEHNGDKDVLVNAPRSSHLGKWIMPEDGGAKSIDSSVKIQCDTTCNMNRPSQKALCTLFVNGIPQNSNKREALLPHFQKFGDVIDIYVPLNSERAFVQFSKREEAEAALRAPDAVMGNRFIKLRWANRDNIPYDGVSSSRSVFLPAHGLGASSLQPHTSFTDRERDIPQPAAPKRTKIQSSETSLAATDHLKPIMMNSPKVTPSQKKLESLEQMKEELRRKQQLLDQKRNDFRRQLNKLEKQATGVKGEIMSEPAAKRHKVGMAADVAEGAGEATPCLEATMEKNKSVENIVACSPKLGSVIGLQESAGSKQPSHPLTPSIAPLLMNRCKLDNQPTAFRIIKPLPTGLANTTALKDYFSSYGEVSSVELEDVELSDGGGDESEMFRNCSARVTYKTHISAGRAYVEGKCWEGNNMQFVWVISGSSIKDPGARENSPPTPKSLLNAEVQPDAESIHTDSKEASVAGDRDPESVERNKGDNHMEYHEVSESCAPSVSCEKSPKAEPSPSRFSGEEETSKNEPSLTATSGEKE